MLYNTNRRGDVGFSGYRAACQWCFYIPRRPMGILASVIEELPVCAPSFPICAGMRFAIEPCQRAGFVVGCSRAEHDAVGC